MRLKFWTKKKDLDTRFLAAIKKLAETKPNFIYTSSGVKFGGYSGSFFSSYSSGCSYKPDTKNPDGCLIGAAWRKTTGEQLEDRGNAETVLQGRGLSYKTIRFALGVQTRQDNGCTWGEAFNRACQDFPNLTFE